MASLHARGVAPPEIARRLGMGVAAVDGHADVHPRIDGVVDGEELRRSHHITSAAWHSEPVRQGFRSTSVISGHHVVGHEMDDIPVASCNQSLTIAFIAVNHYANRA